MKLTPLPIDEVLPELEAALRGSPAVLLRAPTGAGKTTRVPGALLDAGLAGEGEVLVLEPRRLAARAAAARTASERRGRVGDEVGYQVRFDSKRSAKTRITFLTEGLFLRRLQSDPLLEGVGLVVFDEFHERSLDADLALALVRRVQEDVRDDLRLVVMSATLETTRLAAYLGGAPTVESEGRTYPIEFHYLAASERPERGASTDEPIARAVERALTGTDGDVLVFLPGVGEIRRARRALEGKAFTRGCTLFELYGDLPPEEQDRALRAHESRSIFLATNVAETSITLPRVTAVVDTGLAKRMQLDAGLGLNRLTLGPISKASAQQRAGRAGRTGPGSCWRLWTEHDERTRPADDEPEVRRVDVAPALLELVAWGEPHPLDFPWLEAPPRAAQERGLGLLLQLDAVQATREGGVRLTDTGRALARLPLHPRLGRLLLEGARHGVQDMAALGAALLSERSPFRRDGRRELLSGGALDSDLVDRVHALERFDASGDRISAAGELNVGAARQLLRVRSDLLRSARGIEAKRSQDAAESADERLGRALLAAYPDRLARRRAPGDERAKLVGGRGVRLARESGVREAELFLALEVDAGGKESLVRCASEVRPEWLDPALVETRTELAFEAAETRVVARVVTAFLDLELESKPGTLKRDAASAKVLAAAAANDLERALDLAHEDYVALRERVNSLREWMPDLELPRIDADFVRELLPRLCKKKLTFAELRKAPLAPAIFDALDWRQREALDRHAPDRLEVPSGNRHRLAYEEGRPPVLAARIQELFGWTKTPRVAQGRVPVLLHLLAPNYRPQQVTDDLESFWTNTYAEVRKDLRRRYPKHDWPEDPWTAKARRRRGR